MTLKQCAFQHVQHGVTFAVNVYGTPLQYRFEVKASYQGMPLFNQCVRHALPALLLPGATLEDTAQSVFKTQMANRLYLLAVSTARKALDDTKRARAGL